MSQDVVVGDVVQINPDNDHLFGGCFQVGRGGQSLGLPSGADPCRVKDGGDVSLPSEPSGLQPCWPRILDADRGRVDHTRLDDREGGLVPHGSDRGFEAMKNAITRDVSSSSISSALW